MAPRLLARNFAGASLDVSYREIDLRSRFASSLGVPLLVGSVSQQILQMARAAGHGGEDSIAVAKIYESLAGVTVWAP